MVTTIIVFLAILVIVSWFYLVRPPSTTLYDVLNRGEALNGGEVPDEAIRDLVLQCKSSFKKWVLITFPPRVSLQQASLQRGVPITQEDRLLAFKSKVIAVAQTGAPIILFYSVDKGMVCARRGYLIFVLEAYRSTDFGSWNSLTGAVRTKGYEIHSLDGPQRVPAYSQLEGAASRFHLENARLLFDFAQMEEAHSESDFALDLALKEGSTSNYVEALSMRGRSKIARGFLEEAYIDLQEAYYAAKKLDDLSLLTQIEDAIGIYYRDMGQLDQAIDYFERSLNVCYGPPVRSIQGIGIVSANLARTYLYRSSQDGGDLEKAESILRKAIRTLQAHPESDFHGQIPVWQLLALVFIQNGDLENALECLAYELSLKQLSPKQGSTIPVPALLPTVAKRPISALLQILDYLKQELTGSMQAQDVHSQIAIHFFTAKVHSELVRRLKLNGQNSDVDGWHIEQAYSLYKDGIDILEQKLRGRLTAIENRITFIQFRIDAYQDVALTCLKLSLEKHPHRGRDAFFYVERSRSRTFLDLLASSGFRTSISNEIISAPESYRGIQSYL